MRNTSLNKKLIRKIGKCELCGSTRGLEMHHIIPLSLIEDNPLVNTEENLLCVCTKCHALLTPKKVLTSIGVRKAINRNGAKNKALEFYKALNEITENGERLTVDIVLDTFDRLYM